MNEEQLKKQNEHQVMRRTLIKKIERYEIFWLGSYYSDGVPNPKGMTFASSGTLSNFKRIFIPSLCLRMLCLRKNGHEHDDELKSRG